MAKETDVKSVIVLQSDDDFGGEPQTIQGKSPKKKKAKKKHSSTLSPIEKTIFSVVKMSDKATTAYREAHEKSNNKKKNGWIKDFPKNSTKAASKLGLDLTGIKLFE